MKRLKNKLLIALLAACICVAPASVSAAPNDTVSDTPNDTTVSQEPEKDTTNSDNNYLFSENTTGNADLVASQEVITDNGLFQFIAVTTRNGDVFYVIIDKMKTENNVYFLNEVDTYDLQTLLSDDENTTTIVQPNTDISNDNADKDTTSNDDDIDNQSSNNNNFNLMLLGGIVVLGVIAFLIFKIKKTGLGKKKSEHISIDDDFDEEDEEINEDEENI